VSSAAVNADIIVAKDGTGNFTTIQAAIDSVPSNSSKRTVIFVKNGTYKEVVTIRKTTYTSSEKAIQKQSLHMTIMRVN